MCDLDNGRPGGLDIEVLTRLCERYRVPNACRDLARLALQQRSSLQQASGLSPEALLEVFNNTDALRRAERFDDLLVVCAADAMVRQHDCDQAYLLRALNAVQAVNAAALQDSGLTGKDIGQALQALRIEALRQLN